MKQFELVSIATTGITLIEGVSYVLWPNQLWILWLIAAEGLALFIWASITFFIEQSKDRHLQSFKSFLNKKITQGQILNNSNKESICNNWGPSGIVAEERIKIFEDCYAKWRLQINEGCKRAFWDKREMPFSNGQIPQLYQSSNDYRMHLTRDIQQLNYYLLSIRKEEIDKKLNSKSLKEFENLDCLEII